MKRLRPTNSGGFPALCCILIGITIQATAFGQGAADDGQAIDHFESLIKTGDYRAAADLLTKYSEQHQQSWRALYQLGYVEFRLHRIQGSVQALSKCLQMNDRFAEAHKILAFDLNILGRKDLAIAELEKAIRLDQDSAESYYELGRIYFDGGSYVQAVKNLEQAKMLKPDYVKVYHNLGLAYSALGENTKAIQSFDEGLRLNAQQKQPSAWPLIDYATYFNLQGDFEKAKAMLLEAIKINDGWDQEFDELSKAYRGLGQTDLAIRSLKRAVEINPQKPEYHYVLARLYSQTHQTAEAKQELSEYERTHQKAVQK